MRSSEDGEKACPAFITQADGAVVLRLAGDVDVTNIAGFEAVLRQAINDQPKHLVIDLQAVTFLDTAGVLLLLQAYRWQQKAGNALSVQPGEGMVRRTLEVSGLLGILASEANPATPSEAGQ
jgi:anti-sigma B factor antagonist